MLLWGIIALKREDAEVAEGRLARARELLGNEAGAAALVLGRETGGGYPRATCRGR